MQQRAPAVVPVVDAQPVAVPPVPEAHPAANPHTADGHEVQTDAQPISEPTRHVVDSLLPVNHPFAYPRVEQAQQDVSHPYKSVPRAAQKVRRPVSLGNYILINHQALAPGRARLTKWKKQPAGAHPVLPLQRPVIEPIPESDLAEFRESRAARKHQPARIAVPHKVKVATSSNDSTPPQLQAPNSAPGNNVFDTIDTIGFRGSKRKRSDAVPSGGNESLDGKNPVDYARPIKKVKR